jgi:hypothetical protein
MIGLILGILTIVSSIIVAFFLSVSHVHSLVETDFRNTVTGNAVMHSLEWGQLGVRSKTLWDRNITQTVELGHVRKHKDSAYSNLSFTVNLAPDNASFSTDVKIE